MREIKFRAWDRTDHKMMHDFSVSSNDGSITWWIDGEPFEESWQLMQFTGLKDKNGKEIYEGDIIEHWDNRYIVPNFTPLDRSYMAENVLEHHDGSDDWISMSNVDWEVIGNIYENPELLNK